MNKEILSDKTWQKLAERITTQPIGALPGSSVSDELKFTVNNRDDGSCIYCKSKENIQYDHVIPISYGGPATANNIVLACQSCNSIKSNSFRIDFLTIAFNHLLYVGEDIDWVDKIFIPFEDRDEELFELECKKCECRFKYHRFIDFCSDKCEEEYHEKSFCDNCGKPTIDDNFCSYECEDRFYKIESECLMCLKVFFTSEEDEDDFCSSRCEDEFFDELEE